MMPIPRSFSAACEVEDVVCQAEAPGLSPGSHVHAPGYNWTVLQRHGRRPLAVLARVLLQADNKCVGLPGWSEMAIYETIYGRFAASIRHGAPGALGPSWNDAWLCDSPENVRVVFYNHDPIMAIPIYFLLSQEKSGGLLPLNPENITFDTVFRDAAAVQCFRGAWAGLLAAVFGLCRNHRAPV